MKKLILISAFIIFISTMAVHAQETNAIKTNNLIVKEAQEENLNNYLEYVKTKIEPNWPFNLYSDEPAIIEIKISKKGELLESKIIKSSGNSDVDEFVINSAKKAAPFEPFPSGFKNPSYIKAQYGFMQIRKYITPNEGKGQTVENNSD